MLAAEPQFARHDVLRVFNHAQAFLLLGAGTITVGLLAAAFSLLRRRFDRLLFWFALFAILYGLRLVMNYQILWALGLRPQGFQRAVIAIGFLVPIPALFFFERLTLLGNFGRFVVMIVSPLMFCLAMLTLWTGPNVTLRIINNLAVITALLAVVISLTRRGSSSSEINLIRGGLAIFVVGALYDNVTGIFGHYYNLEPFGFVVFLAALGITAGQRALAKEQQLSMIQKELEIARRIQLSILPSSLPDSGSFRVAARYLPMTSVAGDFYDVLVAGDQQTCLLIADVSGHGVPAAMIASMVKLAATSLRVNASNPSQLLFSMNSTLCGNTQNQFVTAACVYFDSSLRELRYSAAAHPPMLLLRRGQVIEISENGLMLAAFGFATYTTLSHPIEPGDRFILYTDGLLEASNVQDEEFGSERLHKLVRETADLPHLEAADRIITSIQDWSASQNDDLTLLLCDYSG
jgi:phosphoserine phosphatase RsbU/P